MRSYITECHGQVNLVLFCYFTGRGMTDRPPVNEIVSVKAAKDKNRPERFMRYNAQ